MASPAGSSSPAPWLLDHLDLLVPGGRMLDVASGRGRHALHLASQGFRVDAIDRDAGAIAELRQVAAREQLTISCRVLDLESEPPPSLGQHVFDGIVVFRYLHRPLFPALVDALAPGGLLIYETFTTARALRGRPTNPRFLLEPGELVTLVAPLVILESREGDVNGQAVASLIATRPR